MHAVVAYTTVIIKTPAVQPRLTSSRYQFNFETCIRKFDRSLTNLTKIRIKPQWESPKSAIALHIRMHAVVAYNTVIIKTPAVQPRLTSSRFQFNFETCIRKFDRSLTNLTKIRIKPQWESPESAIALHIRMHAFVAYNTVMIKTPAVQPRLNLLDREEVNLETCIRKLDRSPTKLSKTGIKP
jgi:hypothetical protein